MDTAKRLYEALNVTPAASREVGDHPVPAHFGEPQAEYTKAATHLAIHHRTYRSLLEITGNDRQSWLHNLTTNQVKNLQPPDGNYAFALNVKGRILFDLNMTLFDAAIWLDLDTRYLPAALEHFNRYIIAEDVRVTDRTADFDRWALLGKDLTHLAWDLGLSNLPAMAQLQNGSASLAGVVTLIRHDFAGVPAAELFIPHDAADDHLAKLIELSRAHDMAPVGMEAIETLRIEAGLPALGSDIDQDILPAETLQIERAVSYSKGCYLGQEVVERMRSRSSLAKTLVGVVFDADRVPPVGAVLHIGDTEGGKLTSTCFSPFLGRPIGLGYLKPPLPARAAPVSAHADGESFLGRLHPLPFTTAHVAQPPSAVSFPGPRYDSAMPQKPSHKKRVTQACAIIENARHQVLIARTDGGDDAPAWEFPADTVGADESPEAAARRAAREKTDLIIEIDVGQPPFEHEFDDRTVTYRYFIAGIISGRAEPLGYEELRWIEKGQLREYEFAPPIQNVVDWLLGS